MIDKTIDKTIDKVIEMFSSSDAIPSVTRTYIQSKLGDLPSRKWSFGNQWLMALANTNDARGFNQWKEVGRRVKKDSKAFHILAPIMRIRKEEKDGEITSTSYIAGFKSIPVFRLEDTEGEDIETESFEPLNHPPLIEVAKAWGIPVNYAPKTAGFWGFYQLGTPSITLCTHDELTWFHELAHAAHHRVKGTLRGGQNEIQEVVAEFVSAVLCEMHGFRGFIPHAKQYIEAYAKKDASKAVFTVLDDVRKVLDEILLPKEEIA